MTKPADHNLWARFKTMSNDSPAKILIVALSVCLVCSILVSSAAVLLKPIQQQNKNLGRQKEILKVAGLYQANIDPVEQFKSIETRYVDIDSGKYADATNSNLLEKELIPDSKDIAGIGSRNRFLPVYLVYDKQQLSTIVLPLVGKGLWSTIHGFIALAADGNTVKAITFYDHAETPGLGGEISNPNWQLKWQGKQIRDSDGNMQLRVIKGHPDPASLHAKYEIDALSGATLTANGVTRLIHYWLSDSGFGPFLARISGSAIQGTSYE